MHRRVRNPPQADLITAAKHVINLARHRKLDERGGSPLRQLLFLPGKADFNLGDGSIFIWGRL
jgi:hypothetical protein